MSIFHQHVPLVTITRVSNNNNNNNNNIELNAQKCMIKPLTVILNFLQWILCLYNTALSKKMDGIWNRYNLKSTGRIYTFGVLKCSEKFKVLDLP